MRLCRLRAALAATPEADRWVLHDPRAWLGNAFHGLMEAMRRGAAPPDSEAIWNAAIKDAVAAALNHPLDRRFAVPERWPSYFLVRQRAFALAAKVGASRGPEGAGVRTGPASHGPPRGPERRFEARGGRLVGRPDDGHILTEYKSSLPDAAWPGAAEIVESFRRQLRLYAVIVADALGTWPASGRVVAASGQALEFKIDPAACNAEADAALAELDTLNGALNVGAAPEDLAAPGVSACAGCPFQIICPAFWQQLGHGNLEEYIDAALEGVLERLEPGPDNDLYTAYVTARSASLHLSREQAVVLRKSVHGALVLSDVGASCRLAGGRVRPDGRLGADFSTAVLAVSSLPGLENSLHQTATAAPLA
jgi:PD-(D/E)XK nuclease superfamily